VRRAGRRNKVTARFTELLDLAREACYIAREDGESPVTAAHVRKALDAKIERHNLYETKLSELIQEGVLLIDTTGTRIGQVNGLSVYEIGGYSFGKPVRITASVALGKAGIINIERESNLSGRIHDKGVQILSGYLRANFAQDKPLSLSASICFEQSYAGVDGDSASSTEIYALLSALSGLPIRQDVAVTGSINQQGDIQPIGGVNQKIEGFFEICKMKGLTGNQGVIIPIENVEDLMLRNEVIDAVTKGQFHILPVTTVNEGIEILTGSKAGARGPDGKFEEGTVFALTDARLRALADTMREYE
jgi:lon-related putative ATP-dependent protease